MRLIYTHTHTFPISIWIKLIYKDYMYIKGVGVRLCIYTCVFYIICVCTRRQKVLFISVYPSINIWRSTKRCVCVEFKSSINNEGVC